MGAFLRLEVYDRDENPQGLTKRGYERRRDMRSMGPKDLLPTNSVSSLRSSVARGLGTLRRASPVGLRSAGAALIGIRTVRQIVAIAKRALRSPGVRLYRESLPIECITST
ncbi:MAG TPA: hypothetical protein DIV79_07640 [Opitutae bacterium]|nr:hypothetical protein [Opitutaceae bacterium]HCR29870.1 hypothetical protein [Opitutae bacterium]